jgi:hypothetical protein
VRLFDRACRVTVYRPDGKPIDRPLAAGDATSFVEKLENGLEIDNLRVVFEVERSLGKDPNTCDVRIYNLAERTRAVFRQLPLTVKLDVGYDKIERNLALGSVRFADSTFTRNQWETKLLLKDGGRAFAHARAAKSYKDGTPLRRVLTDLAATMGLTLPKALAEDRRLDDRLPYGEVLDGWSRDEMTRLMAPLGYTWSIQNGQLQALADEQVRPDATRTIGEVDGQVEGGLIGTPEYGAPNKKTGQRTLSFQCLLYPELIPGCVVQMESRSVKGRHKLVKVRHEGDTHGRPWYTTCEAHAL